MISNLPEGSILFIDGANGLYIPQIFFERVTEDEITWHCDEDIKEDILKICKDPYHDHYWEAWDDACQWVIVTINDTEYYPHHEMDLWLVPVGAEWPEQDEDELGVLFRDLDHTEELKFREWARNNFNPATDKIDILWHPIIQEECRKILTEYIDNAD